MDYLDFEVEVSPKKSGAYTVRVIRSPAGEATGSMRFPFSPLALQNRLQALQIALLRSDGKHRRIELPEVRVVQTFGGELWKSLFSDDVLSRYEVSRAEARRQNAGIRVKLRIAAPELAALPWEYLFDTGRSDYLSLSVTTPIVRYIEVPEPIEPLTVAPPLRILGVIADPSDLPELDVQRERQRLEAAVDRLRSHGLVDLQWVPNGTWRDLRQALRHGPWHIVHYIGHGGFDEVHGEGMIALVDEDGTSHRLSATDLGRLLGDHEALRLVVLNSCESARSDRTDVFSSTASVLVRRGTPAVVAMQFEITDPAAIEFSRSFYEAVADGLPVDTAVSEARKGIAVTIPDTLEWGTPVLFTRAPDGVLFRMPEGLATAAIERSTGSRDEPLASAPVRRDVRAAFARWIVRPRNRLVSVATGAVALVLAAVLLFGGGATPLLTMSTAQARAGDVVQLTGSGFTGGNMVSLVVAGEVVRTVMTDADGTFAIDLEIPDGLPANVQVAAVDSVSGRSTGQSLEVLSAIAGSPSSAPPASASAVAAASPSLSTSAGPSASAGVTASEAPGASADEPKVVVPDAATSPPRAQATPTPTPKPPKVTPRPTVPPTPAPTPAPQLVVETTVDIPPDSEVDADSGAITSGGADLWFQVVGPSERYLVPSNGARIGYHGGQAPGRGGCLETGMAENRIPMDGITGEYLCMRTTEGQVSELRLLALDETMQLRIRTWDR